jgi:hypothetical protein
MQGPLPVEQQPNQSPPASTLRSMRDAEEIEE